MKIWLSRTIICILILNTYPVFSQNIKPSKIEFSLISGLSIPIASYGRNDPELSAIYIINAPSPSVKGFNKYKSGFANIGFDYSVEIKYYLNNKLNLLFRAGSFSNSVETNGMSEFLTQINGDRETRVEEGDYHYLYFTPGIGYYRSKKNFDLGFDLMAGYSMTEYPYYKFVLLYTNVNPPIIFAHLGPKPNLQGLTFGGQLSVDYHIFNQIIIGINFAYQSANYKYKVQPSSYPGGGGTNLEYSDILKTRVLNFGLKLGVRL